MLFKLIAVELHHVSVDKLTFTSVASAKAQSTMKTALCLLFYFYLFAYCLMNTTEFYTRGHYSVKKKHE